MKLILASASPRRREILTNAGYSYAVRPADIEETVEKDLPASQVASLLASLKAAAVYSDVTDDSIVLAADTIVVLNGEILGKPTDEADAIRMLSMLSGKTHEVYTGVCLLGEKGERKFSQVTKVKFYKLTQQEILQYIATGEPMDKAGAYGIQGKGCLLIEEIQGDYFNVVGLPIALVHRELLNY